MSSAMVKDVKVELVHEGFYELLNSQAVLELCTTQAERIAQSASAASGGSYEVEYFHSTMNGGRVGVAVETADRDAMVSEAEYGTLMGQVH